MEQSLDPREAIAALERAFASADPGPRDYLRVVREDEVFAYGSVAVPLVGRMVLDRSGLYVPPAVARGRNPLDQLRVFVTPRDLFGVEMPIEYVGEQLVKVPLEYAVAWAASILASLNSPGADVRVVEDNFVERYFAGELKVRARNVLRDPARVLLIPQAVQLFIKLAFVVCESSSDTELVVEHGPLVLALLQLPAHIDSGVEGLSEDDMVVGADPGQLACFIIANQMFNASPDLKSSWATFQRCWRELPVELADHPKVRNLQAEYEASTGVPLDDLVIVCALLWAHTVTTANPTVEMAYFAALGWELERLENVLNFISSGPVEVRQMLAADVETAGVVWSTKTFEQYPVIRWGNHLTVVDPDLLVRRSSGMWPMYDILRVLEFEQGAAGQANSSQLKACLDHLHEEFAREVLAGISGEDRLYSEDDLRAAYGRKHKVADVAVDYGHAWVVADVTTTGFKLTTAAGNNVDSVARDLDHVVAKARQIEATINDIRGDESKLTGKAAFPGRRTFYPVLVIAARFAASPVSMTLLRERLAEAGVLQDADVAPLEVMELEDLLAVEGTVERHGFDMLTLLAEKATASMALMSMRHFLREKLAQPAPHPERVNSRCAGWFDTVLKAVRPAA